MDISSILLSGNRIVAMGNLWSVYRSESSWSPETHAVLLSISPTGVVQKDESTVVKGSYTDARMRNNEVCVFTRFPVGYNLLYNELSRYHQDFSGFSENEYTAAAHTKLEALIPEWRNQLIEDIFFYNQQLDMDMVRNTIQLFRLHSSNNDEEIYLPFNETYNAFTSVSSFRMSDGFSSMRRGGAFTTGYGWSDIYSNGELIVVANNGWQTTDEGGWTELTYLISFLAEDTEITPLSVGQIEGSVLNQFSMDYHADHLRVATTCSANWIFDDAGDEWVMESQSESFITVLDLSHGNMEIVGKVGGLGLGERIMSVRFFGDMGFVVTFRQIDPFYTLDLLQAGNPLVKGELKIPGFSNYLHPMDGNYILAIGQDADETGITTGFQVSVYDVAALDNPLQLHTYSVDDNSYSDAQWDHHAFRYVSSKNLLVVPLHRWMHDGEYAAYQNSFSLFSISVTEGIQKLGEIDHSTYDPYDYSFRYSYAAPRSMVFGNSIITMDGAVIQSHELPTLEKNWSLNIK